MEASVVLVCLPPCNHHTLSSPAACLLLLNRRLLACAEPLHSVTSLHTLSVLLQKHSVIAARLGGALFGQQRAVCLPGLLWWLPTLGGAAQASAHKWNVQPDSAW